MSHIFKILAQTGDINVSVLCDNFFSRYVLLKAPFVMKKTPAVKSETHLRREDIGN